MTTSFAARADDVTRTVLVVAEKSRRDARASSRQGLGRILTGVSGPLRIDRDASPVLAHLGVVTGRYPSRRTIARCCPPCRRGHSHSVEISPPGARPTESHPRLYPSPGTCPGEGVGHPFAVGTKVITPSVSSFPCSPPRAANSNSVSVGSRCQPILRRLRASE